jgi:hypothetical protein
MIEEKESQSITKTSVSSKFKMWFETRGGRNKPKGQEVWDALIRRYPDRYTQLERGKMGWKGLVFKEDNPDNHVDEDKHEQTLS